MKTLVLHKPPRKKDDQSVLQMVSRSEARWIWSNIVYINDIGNNTNTDM